MKGGRVVLSWWAPCSLSGRRMDIQYRPDHICSPPPPKGHEGKATLLSGCITKGGGGGGTPRGTLSPKVSHKTPTQVNFLNDHTKASPPSTRLQQQNPASPPLLAPPQPSNVQIHFALPFSSSSSCLRTVYAQ
ncbi:hypothetical protein IE53DRAFT_232850 [Violaceomyces palustris]|uniref:Uncharacterized protein n=1 Tax=Violaceomyces palustris TaxID=1673888 RepID=A0ACD0P4H2_9BASI|nr:hypothetical protein IE53DRAFT_232850 [Violaceomyces palustris]